jgi:hypothetical protein
MTSLTGGCLCGSVRYTIGAPVTALRACHCVNCRKSSGAAGTVNAVVKSSDFKITQGSTRRYEDSATLSGRTLSRHFCADCGSPVYSQRNPDPGFLVVRAGSLDDSRGLKIATNIWTGSAVTWSYIDPASEQHSGNMPAK